MKSYENNVALAGPASRSMAKEEAQFAAEVLGGAFAGSLGGAGKAALLNRILTKLKIPRGTAKKMVEMMGKPSELPKAIAYAQKKGIRVGPLAASIAAYMTEASENE